jgi:hypothetical protein
MFADEVIPFSGLVDGGGRVRGERVFVLVTRKKVLLFHWVFFLQIQHNGQCGAKGEHYSLVQ